eukprot:5362751-Alexandrium_andersonii.AAC.1
MDRPAAFWSPSMVLRPPVFRGHGRGCDRHWRADDGRTLRPRDPSRLSSINGCLRTSIRGH